MNRHTILRTLLLASLLLVGSIHATTYTVTDLSDSGAGTLRDAINNANADMASGPHTINFSVSGKISLATPLPALNNSFGIAITIDGYSASGATANTDPNLFTGVLKIEIDGSGIATGSNNAALTLTSGGNTIKGLVINGCDGDKRAIYITGSNNLVLGCIIGLNKTGTAAQAPATFIGIKIGSGTGNYIGTTQLSDRNVISGCNTAILDQGTSTTISGNLIGLAADGSTIVGNTLGIDLASALSSTIGGTITTARNVISGNTVGINLSSANNITIAGNYIGTNATGASKKANGDGIIINDSCSGNTIGGTALNSGNLISGNTNTGITITGSSTDGSYVQGNLIGTDATGLSAIGNGTGVLVTGANTDAHIGGTSASASNIISGNTIGIEFSNCSTSDVKGCVIGLDKNGGALGNDTGVLIDGGAQSNHIGGSAAGERNVISGNISHGVLISGSSTTGNNVQGNYIGVGSDGVTAIGNAEGVVIDTGSNGNLIGGDPTASEGNVISGNTDNGVWVKDTGSDNNNIYGNLIGLDTTGLIAVPNVNIGVHIDTGPTACAIGGNNGRNIISGNAEGVRITAADGNFVQGNNIGTDSMGTNSVPNGDGIVLQSTASNNLIGGSAAGEPNLIAGNTTNGIKITDAGTTGNQVEGNSLGDLLGNAVGVSIEAGATGNTIGGTTVLQANAIDNNGIGVLITGTGTNSNVVHGNFIGTTTDNSVAGNTTGVRIELGAKSNMIGGPAPGERNVISNNTQSGVEISDAGTSSNTVSGNYIGTDIFGSSAASTNGDGVKISNGATNNTIGGSTPADRNIISGNSYGVYITGTGTGGNGVFGNYIGTNATADGPISNSSGVYINADTGNLIGDLTTTPGTGKGNVVSGNATGIELNTPAKGNQIKGNLIGTDASGASAMSNNIGIRLTDAANNLIGGPVTGGGNSPRNIISGNALDGIAISGAGSTGNNIEGNFIGLDITGTSAIANPNGIRMNGLANNNNVGSSQAGSGNVISGNTNGVFLVEAGTDGNKFLRNYIGTDATGTAAVPNSFGIKISDASNTIIGGNASGDANFVSGNNSDGIMITGAATSTQVVGNVIGLDSSVIFPLGNGNGGVTLGFGAKNSLIGGPAPADGNIIAYNKYGVQVGVVGNDPTTTGNQILSNSIYSNTTLGIELGFDGIVTPNDIGDIDTGPNNLQNFPVLTNVVVSSVNSNIGVAGTLDSSLVPVKVQVFLALDSNATGYGQGKTFLLEGVANTNGTFAISGTALLSNVKVGDVVTATATTLDGTSEFSANLAAIANSAPTANAGPDQTLLFAPLITLDGSASADSDALPNGSSILNGNFFWKQVSGPPVTLNNPNSANPTFAPTLAGTYVFSLTVNDGVDDSTNQAQVTVTLTNNPPTIVSMTSSLTVAAAGAQIDFNALATDLDGNSLTYTWDFGDGQTGSGAFVQHVYNPGTDMAFTVTLTVSDGPSSVSNTLSIQILAPNSGGTGIPNISQDDPPVDNPLNGLTIGVNSSNGGIIELFIDVNALRAAEFSVSTDFDGIQGRAATRTGTRPTHKFTRGEIAVATATATDINTNTPKGKARKTLVVSSKEVGEAVDYTDDPPDRTFTMKTIKGNFLFGRQAGATAPREDTVTIQGRVTMPKGMDLSKPQNFAVGIGNIIDEGVVDQRGKAMDKGALGRIKKVNIKYPKLPKGQTRTGENQTATVNITLSTTDMAGKGFDTEGVTGTANDLDAKNSAKRKIQLGLFLGGAAYEGRAEATFKTNKTRDTGVLQGRGAR